MVKALAAGIWSGLCVYTVITGDVSVFGQAMAQGVLAVIMAIQAFTDD